jgi:hypothetical protein
MTLQQYAEAVYFPTISRRKRARPPNSGYFNLDTKQIQPHIGGLRLSTCSTFNAFPYRDSSLQHLPDITLQQTTLSAPATVNTQLECVATSL